VETHPCTQEELGFGENGFDDPNSKFYPPHPDTELWLNLFWKKFNCVDTTLDVHGDYNSHAVSHF